MGLYSKDEKPLKEAIELMLKTFKLKEKFAIKNIENSWESLVGKTIASRTESIFMKQGVLIIKVNSPALKHELNMAKDSIIELVNEKSGFALVKEVQII
jgi:predicted nucleic acid-binding Zn ribbon protein